MIFQNDKRLCEKINLYGCRFRCLQAIAEKHVGKELTCEVITEAYDMHKKDLDVMNENCQCSFEEHEIIDHAFCLLGSECKARQIGIMRGDVPMGWDKNPTFFDYMILHWRTGTRDGHFTLADKDGREIYDPWDHSEHTLSKRSVMRKLLYRVYGCSR